MSYMYDKGITILEIIYNFQGWVSTILITVLSIVIIIMLHDKCIIIIIHSHAIKLVQAGQ